MRLPDIELFYRELGDRIKTERLKRKISQEDLSIQMDLTRASIINLEKGRHRPSIYQLISIANFFDIEYTSLIPVDNTVKKVSQPFKINMDNIVIDQKELEGSARTAVMNFLSSINK